MLTWQISCTQNGVLQKMTLEVQKVYVKFVEKNKILEERQKVARKSEGIHETVI